MQKPIRSPAIARDLEDLYRIPYKTCALDESWHIRPEDYKQPNGGVIFPNPNAPTGLLIVFRQDLHQRRGMGIRIKTQPVAVKLCRQLLYAGPAGEP